MNDEPLHTMIAEARFYEDISDELASGAIAVLEAAGVTYERVSVPGAFEIPAAISMALRSREFYSGEKRFDGYIALGCVIRGETSHYEYICRESAHALQGLAREYSLALGYGILTVENQDQAWERASTDKKNKGADTARACLRMIEVKRHFHLYPR